MAAFNPCLPVLVVGGSGSGKTYSIKGFAGCPSAVGVLSVEKGRLPFRSGIKTVKVPEAFQGLPSLLLYIAGIAMAIYALTGHGVATMM